MSLLLKRYLILWYTLLKLLFGSKKVFVCAVIKAFIINLKVFSSWLLFHFVFKTKRNHSYLIPARVHFVQRFLLHWKFLGKPLLNSYTVHFSPLSLTYCTGMYINNKSKRLKIFYTCNAKYYGIWINNVCLSPNMGSY